MNGYICFCKGQKLEVYAETTYKAQQEAFEQFKKRFKKIKSYDVDVYLAEVNGKQYVHTPDF